MVRRDGGQKMLCLPSTMGAKTPLMVLIVHRNAPSSVTASTSRYCARAMSEKGTSLRTAALFANTSRRPKRVRISATVR